mgnify:CR=1 FL=1
MNDVSFLQKDDNLIDALNELKQNWLSVINHTNTKDKEIFVYKVLKHFLKPLFFFEFQHLNSLV